MKFLKVIVVVFVGLIIIFGVVNAGQAFGINEENVRTSMVITRQPVGTAVVMPTPTVVITRQIIGTAVPRPTEAYQNTKTLP